ncbi:MAG: flagellar biosynthesis protein FlhF, partial [Burkholderiaceae bacterium]
MNIKRFHAATSREALAKARMAFGEGTLILSNRPTANGVEVVATAEDTLSTLDQGGATSAPLQSAIQARAAEAPRRAPMPQPQPAARRTVEADTEQLAMSTLSFQD